MRWRIPRYGIFFMVVLIVMGLGLLFMGGSDGPRNPGPTGVDAEQVEQPGDRR